VNKIEGGDSQCINTEEIVGTDRGYDTANIRISITDIAKRSTYWKAGK
jgi:hypothetical protein